MRAFEQELQRKLEILEKENLLRRLRRVDSPPVPNAVIDGKPVLNFSSNDYLGLATHPSLKDAALVAVREFGTGSGASRLVCGSLHPHEALEEEIARFKGAGAALVFSTGYATSLGTITALVSKRDIIVLDKLVHASIVDAARLAGAQLRVFAHNDLQDLEQILRWCEGERDRNPETRVFIVTESLFSMDGDVAPLREIVALKEKFAAWLMVDEAHATGLFGPHRRGLIDEFGLSGQVEIQMGTLGKALGSAGGFIAGDRVLREYLINKARSFVFSTAQPPAVSASARAAIELVSSAEGAPLVDRLRRNIRQFHELTGIPAPAAHSPIVPFLVGDEAEALALAARLLESGIYVPAIRYPTVARGKARLRFTFSAAHSEADIERLAAALRKLREHFKK